MGLKAFILWGLADVGGWRETVRWRAREDSNL